ncbi:MAG: peptide MFS transporter [Bacteroidales bacterium]|nr:peptide MFS transporter [Bacteroidales bacterium]MBR4773227.1 peptide MFS transporter [Bacteroidales bacterium]
MLVAGLIVVTPFIIFYVRKALKEHPKGLIPAALSNMGERFGYYIMNAVLTLFICSKFGVPDQTAGIMFAGFYFLIYVLSLPGGIIADRTKNYKGTIIAGIIVMAVGYAILSVPVFSGHGFSWVMVLTLVALVIIACGNGLFKGNLQAVVGQLYDDFEAEEAKKGPEALAKAKEKRDSGFQIFYVFINIGGVIAPFIAPIIRNWWLGTKGLVYNAQLPMLCHNYLTNNMQGNDMDNLTALTAQYPEAATDLASFCDSYITVFNTGVHFAFIASVIAMLISLTIFLCTKKGLPNPVKKEAAAANDTKEVTYSAEEKAAMAKDVKQRMAGLYAVLGVCVFFWFAFHQNAESLSLFARDFVSTSSIPPEIWQCINPFLVVILTPLIMWMFASFVRKGKEVSTPKKIAFGMGIAACAYLFLMLLCMINGYPSVNEFRGMPVETASAMKVGPWALIVTYFFLTVAELFISPLGLSFVSKIAPKHIQGICQGLWLSATAIGNLLILLGPVLYNGMSNLWMCWLVFLLVCAIAMFVMFGMLKWLEKITSEKQ